MTGWLETSYMARTGVAKGKTGATHQLNEAKQGKYHYVYGPYAEPVLRIRPGDVVVAETHDAFEGHPRQLTVLNIAHEFVTLMIMGLIIGLFGA